jgi:ribosomal protein L6P/L9E
MGFIKEPEGIDLTIESKPLTDKQEKELSEYISRRKLEIRKQSKKTRLQKRHTHKDVSIP